MGFFGSRKAEDNDLSHVSTATSPPSDKSVVQVLRARFSGNKGKEREVDHIPYHSVDPKSATKSSGRVRRAASDWELISSTKYSAINGIGASPRPSVSQRNYPPPPSILQKTYDDRPLPAAPSKKRSIAIAEAASGSSASRSVPSTPTKRPGDASRIAPASTPKKQAADGVTATLATRLNELAVANAEGLLTDDEYRLLRQSLFDRFASATTVPQEESVVPAARPRPSKDSANPEGRPSARPASNFQVEVPRPSSIHSSRSSTLFSNGVADLLRKATGKRSSTVAPPENDTSSIWSGKSGSSNFFRFRSISKKSSASSIGSTLSTSRGQSDTISISSKRAGSSDYGHHTAPSGNRSTTSSVRKMKAPPSSFPTRVIGQDTKHTHSIRDVFDEEKLKTTVDIQKEIQAVEAEQRRLMDAFNGLELTTLSKARRQHHPKQSLRSPSEGSHNAGMSETRSQRRMNGSDSDAVSVRSGTSAVTSPSIAPSMARSVYSSRSKTLRAKGGHSLHSSISAALPSPMALNRKNSSSSVNSGERSAGPAPPPVPPLPATISLGHLRTAAHNSSTPSLIRSNNHLPMDVVHEDEDNFSPSSARADEEVANVEDDMDDIRRRREEVAQRYDARLDYLRAKLKGAQLHEKLLKK
ncbi:hypothetical protein BKA70DRAFT_1264888 [Coprinopsis sp. MPI-PUGE-AT-0042]|nr:hypothetical protein BKA70DRAFT_1264888 [Coprinopsis sp. MPI-PUGE-AT-0042]